MPLFLHIYALNRTAHCGRCVDSVLADMFCPHCGTLNTGQHELCCFCCGKLPQEIAGSQSTTAKEAKLQLMLIFISAHLQEWTDFCHDAVCLSACLSNECTVSQSQPYRGTWQEKSTLSRHMTGKIKSQQRGGGQDEGTNDKWCSTGDCIQHTR